MKSFWQNLSNTEKTKLIIFSLLTIMLLVFSIRNWQETELHIFFTVIDIPITLLILFSMLVGFGIAKVFTTRK